jgi:1-acyl-sn-glycerol-3-phosphate acyltransferase
MKRRNYPIHPVLRVIYACLRILAKTGVWGYYRRRLLINPELLKFDGPTIVICNHPSTLTDVLVTAPWIKQEMFFLANYSLFKNPLSNYLLSHLFCIPIKRKEDVAPDNPRDNQPAFEKSVQHLINNGTLFIAPEGYSWMNRFVRPFKTGTARIAFLAELKTPLNNKLKIVPIGLSYTQPNHFRSEVVVHAGDPILVSEFLPQYRTNPQKAIDNLTNHLEKTLKQLCIHAGNESGEKTLLCLEHILKYHKPLTQNAAYYRSKWLCEHHISQPSVQSSATQYTQLKNTIKITELGLHECFHPKATYNAVKDVLLLLIGLPLAALAVVIWFLPLWIPASLTKILNLYVGYASNVKILTGLFTGTTTLVVLAYSVNRFAGCLPAILSAPAAILLALLLEQYTDVTQRVIQRFQAASKAKKFPKQIAQLRQYQKNILNLLPEYNLATT